MKLFLWLLRFLLWPPLFVARGKKLDHRFERDPTKAADRRWSSRYLMPGVRGARQDYGSCVGIFNHLHE